ncbi:MAG: bifunctional DedA family/phosphatase PAP2 family protein [Marinobacter sp.]|uniref:bifunctional DedA family/phosphatase PAP2 family protein n=1 Tax=Marinobacter sp. TaxID=50741 RepID=UPI00299E958B|nr:bifunctional DedA family/phosphatase PAP2 family protein [Marinobacter sp.]MDX1755798.1 bifunctional DedA family/phosphatase PAP2 family protein [Marinobacter sp.]
MIPDWLQPFTDWFAGHPTWLVLALFLVSFLESLAIAGILVPGVAILFAFAALSGQAGLPLSEALLWAGLGAVAGDGVSFWLGRLFHDRLDGVWPFSRYPVVIHKGERFFHQHGGKSVVIGRFVGPIRPVIPLVAGALMMPWRRFLAFNVISAIGWAPVYILPGYLVGSALGSELALPPHFYPVLGISLVALSLIYLTLFRVQLGLSRDSRLYARLADWMSRYNSTHQFWRLLTSERPDSAGEFPLPSIMLTVGSGALLLLWTLLIRYLDWPAAMDEAAQTFFAGLRHPLLDPAMTMITALGNPVFLATGAVLAALALWFRGYYAAAVHALLALGLTVAGVWLLKVGLAVPRPPLVDAASPSWAYPSGHTTGITVFLGLLASFIAREQPRHLRWRTYLTLSAPMVLVGLSRLYLEVHWFSDVIGGILLGLSVCGLVRASYSRYDQIPIWPDITLAAAALVWLGLAAGGMMSGPGETVFGAPW